MTDTSIQNIQNWIWMINKNEKAFKLYSISMCLPAIYYIYFSIFILLHIIIYILQLLLYKIKLPPEM